MKNSGIMRVEASGRGIWERFRSVDRSPGSDCRRGAKWVQNLVFRTMLS